MVVNISVISRMTNDKDMVRCIGQMGTCLKVNGIMDSSHHKVISL